MRFTSFVAVVAACGIMTTPQAASFTQSAIDHSYQPLNLLQLDGASHAKEKKLEAHRKKVED